MATATLERGKTQREKLAEIEAGLGEIQMIREDVLRSQKRVSMLEQETQVLLNRLEELIPDPISRLKNA
jgi:hypothetical protein